MIIPHNTLFLLSCNRNRLPTVFVNIFEGCALLKGWAFIQGKNLLKGFKMGLKWAKKNEIFLASKYNECGGVDQTLSSIYDERVWFFPFYSEYVYIIISNNLKMY